MQVQLHVSLQHGLSETVQVGNFSTYEMASYIMHRQVIAARVRQGLMQRATQADGSLSAGPPPLPSRFILETQPPLIILPPVWPWRRNAPFNNDGWMAADLVHAVLLTQAVVLRGSLRTQTQLGWIMHTSRTTTQRENLAKPYQGRISEHVTPQVWLR